MGIAKIDINFNTENNNIYISLKYKKNNDFHIYNFNIKELLISKNFIDIDKLIKKGKINKYQQKNFFFKFNVDINSLNFIINNKYKLLLPKVSRLSIHFINEKKKEIEIKKNFLPFIIFPKKHKYNELLIYFSYELIDKNYLLDISNFVKKINCNNLLIIDSNEMLKLNLNSIKKNIKNFELLSLKYIYGKLKNKKWNTITISNSKDISKNLINSINNTKKVIFNNLKKDFSVKFVNIRKLLLVNTKFKEVSIKKCNYLYLEDDSNYKNLENIKYLKLIVWNKNNIKNIKIKNVKNTELILKIKFEKFYLLWDILRLILISSNFKHKTNFKINITFKQDIYYTVEVIHIYKELLDIIEYCLNNFINEQKIFYEKINKYIEKNIHILFQNNSFQLPYFFEKENTKTKLLNF